MSKLSDLNITPPPPPNVKQIHKTSTWKDFCNANQLESKKHHSKSHKHATAWFADEVEKSRMEISCKKIWRPCWWNPQRGLLVSSQTSFIHSHVKHYHHCSDQLSWKCWWHVRKMSKILVNFCFFHHLYSTDLIERDWVMGPCCICREKSQQKLGLFYVLVPFWALWLEGA